MSDGERLTRMRPQRARRHQERRGDIAEKRRLVGELWSIWRVTAVVRAAAIAFLTVGFFPGVAGADLLATLEVPSQAGSDLDLATFNIATRMRLAGPGVNTSANEFHPSMAGNRLVFERQQTGVVRLESAYRSRQANTA